MNLGPELAQESFKTNLHEMQKVFGKKQKIDLEDPKNSNYLLMICLCFLYSNKNHLKSLQYLSLSTE